MALFAYSKTLTFESFHKCGMLAFGSTRDEFCAWRKKIVTSAKLAGLNDIVTNPAANKDTVDDGGSVAAESAEKKDKDKGKKDEETGSEQKALLAYSLILNQLDAKLTKQMDSIEIGDVSGLMKALNNKFDPSTTTSEIQLKVDLFRVKQNATETITDFAIRVENIAFEIGRFGEKSTVTDSDLQYALYQGCNEKFEREIKTIISSNQKKNYQDLVNQLRNFELLNKINSSTGRELTTETVQRAFTVNEKNHNDQNTRSKSCYLCKGEGHFIRNCPYNLKNTKSKNQDEDLHCVICNKSNHSLKDCRFNGLTKRGNKQPAQADSDNAQ